MILSDELIKIVRSQRKNLDIRDVGTLRQDLVKIKPEKNFAIVISGIRRCGKSTLLLQSMNQEGNYHYLNFEDPRLTDFTLKEIETLEEAFLHVHGENDLYYFDEIQNLTGWERYVRYLLEMNKQVIITCSNASLLNQELGTKLTGRTIRLELFPFSYQEYLHYTGFCDSEESFRAYLITGGFPEYIRTGLNEVLQNLLVDIIARDIVIRYNLKNPGLITEIAVYLLGNISCEFSYSKLQKVFSAIGSVTTIASYIHYLQDAYLLFTLPRFSYSQKSRQINPKKIYGIDNGLINVNTTGFSDDYGRLLENYVFLFLRKKYGEIFYFRERRECDFIIKEKTKITKAIQVCFLVNNQNKDREIQGLLEAMHMFDLDEGYILTEKQEDTLTVEGKRITLIPARNYVP
ncbi:MAG: ATP-binding protein [Methanospirillaceae archaeon]|nr:ATP-binding protein [Methanospirillaceae archaeon]